MILCCHRLTRHHSALSSERQLILRDLDLKLPMDVLPQVIIATETEMYNYILLLAEINLNLKLWERLSPYHSRSSFQIVIKMSFPV